MKKILAILLCLSIALGALSGCVGQEAQAPSPQPSDSETPSPTETPEPSPTEPPVVLTMASAGMVTGTNKGNAFKKAFEELKSQSGGRLAIDLFEGGEKGTDAEIIDAVKSGAVSIYTGGASMMQEAIPQLAVLDIPMMFSSIEGCNAVLGGAFTEMMQPFFNEAGMQLIGAYSTAFHHFTSSVPVAAPGDLKGIRMTTSKSEYHQLFWKTLGCNVLPLERSQVYIALKQGMHGAQENTYREINTLKLYEVQSSLIKTRHTQDVGLFVINKAQYDALTDEQRTLIGQFVSQAISAETEAVAEDEASQETNFGKKKMAVTEPTSELLVALKAAVQPVIDSIKENIDPALVDSYIAACKSGAAAPAPTATPDTSNEPTE
jgi:TRAP-type C4-dicarboxylate transport system substrate-binding protein